MFRLLSALDPKGAQACLIRGAVPWVMGADVLNLVSRSLSFSVSVQIAQYSEQSISKSLVLIWEGQHKPHGYNIASAKTAITVQLNHATSVIAVPVKYFIKGCYNKGEGSLFTGMSFLSFLSTATQ